MNQNTDINNSFQKITKNYFDTMFFVINNSYIVAQKSADYDILLRKTKKSTNIKDIISVYAYLRVIKHTILELPNNIKDTQDMQRKYQICLSSMKRLEKYFSSLSPKFKNAIDAFSDYMLFPAIKRERGKNYYKSILNDFNYFKKSKIVEKHFIPSIFNAVLKDYYKENNNFKDTIPLDIFIINYIIKLEMNLEKDILGNSFKKIKNIVDFFFYYNNYDNCLNDIIQKHNYAIQVLLFILENNGDS